jgi:hypothetical protein
VDVTACDKSDRYKMGEKRCLIPITGSGFFDDTKIRQQLNIYNL